MSTRARLLADRPEDLTALGARLRRLADQAAAGGGAREQIEEDVTEIFRALLAFEDPRRRQSLRLAKRMAAAKASGTTVAEIAVEYRRSRSQVHRLLAVARSHATLSPFNNVVESGNDPKP